MAEINTIEVPSRRFGRYRVLSRLGAGGMAEVFLAEVVDEQGDQVHVALKLMREGVTEEAFADEADLMGLLTHPNLVQRLEVGVAFGRPFIAMEYLIGGDLRELMEAHSREMSGLPTAMGVHVVLEVLKALAYFHQAKTRTGQVLGLVHGDVNPSNVFFSGQGEVKLGDFGVAKSRALTIGPGDGVAAGKLHYLSPEQTRGEMLTPASDLFSVGVMLHELVVGYHPFRTEDPSPKAVMAAIRAARLSLPDYLEKPLVPVLQRSLAPDTRVRYRTAGEFAGDLFRYALDHDLCQSQKDVQGWLEGMLGLVV
ncbi:MAG: serine/threonine-protein kinase [Myxococcota bacterium]